MMNANSRIRFALPCLALQIVFFCTLHHFIIIIVQIYLQTLNSSTCVSDIFVECVSKIKLILSVILYTQCGAVCFQFTHFPCDDSENIYTLSYYHHQIGSMGYYSGLDHETMACAVCLSIFLIQPVIKCAKSMPFWCLSKDQKLDS